MENQSTKKEPTFVIKEVGRDYFVAQRGVVTKKKYARQFTDAEARGILARLNEHAITYMTEPFEEEENKNN